MTGRERRVRIILADDHAGVRDGLVRLVNEQPDMQIVADTGNGRDALQLAQRLSPDVALVDVSMPGWDGVKLTRELRQSCPSLSVIAVTRHNDARFVEKMTAAGACGYVLKPNARETLVDAIRACVSGGRYVDPGVRPISEAAAAPVPSSDHQPLTAAEEAVLRLFGAAWSTQMIAEELGLDRQDVARVREAAMRKLGFSHRLEALTYLQSLPAQTRASAAPSGKS